MGGRLLQVVVASVVIGLVAGGAYALGAGSGGGGKIVACAKRHGGALRLAKKCRHGERRVSWAKRGPRGRRGLPGVPGQNGSPGAAGSARAYAWVHGGSSATLDAKRSRGFTGVSHPGSHAGYYCLALPVSIDAAKVAPQASIVWNSGFAGVPEYALVDDPANEAGTFKCAGNALEILIMAGSTPAPNSNLDFTVVVP